MKKLAWLLLLVATGCATSSKTVVRPSVLENASHVIYFEQADRVSKDVLLAAYGDKGPVANALSTIPVELIGQVIESLLKVIPEVSTTFSNERMNNVLVGRRMLFIGYTGEELAVVERLIRAMTEAIERFSPPQAPSSLPNVSVIEDGPDAPLP